MVQQQTILRVSDNSGARFVQCIKVSKGFKRRTASLGDIITVSIKQLRKKARFRSKVKKGEIHKAIILRVKKKIVKLDGSVFWFKNNAVCLLNKKKTPIATRILGSIPRVLKKQNFLKFASISGRFV
uniref:Ribosomal protein L14 n=1 Tax=Toxarium undulatum TaxID=210620 RepID=A0A2U9GI57_9STRA|nr:ribosomal protein L14 [Toxarium undulatum]AWQ64147.1 ribosomal protein L14 [Toxarium undulatum]